MTTDASPANTTEPAADAAIATTTAACMEVWGGHGATDAALVLHGWQGWVLSRPHKGADIGGDVHYVSSCGTGRITRLMLADVAGHGEPASGVAGFLRGLMQRYLNHISPHKLAAEMNQRLSAHEQDAGNDSRFATALIMTYFSPTGDLSLCNAGHPPPMLYRPRTGRWSALDQLTADDGVTNLPLGIVEQAGYVGRELRLDPGDTLLAYTDCLVEAQNETGELLGVPGLCEVLNEVDDPAQHNNARQWLDALLKAIEQRGYHMDDDLTAVVLRSTGRTNGATLREKLAGMRRGLRRVWQDRVMPWPEFSVRNIGGGLLPALNRYRSR